MPKVQWEGLVLQLLPGVDRNAAEGTASSVLERAAAGWEVIGRWDPVPPGMRSDAPAKAASDEDLHGLEFGRSSPVLVSPERMWEVVHELERECGGTAAPCFTPEPDAPASPLSPAIFAKSARSFPFGAHTWAKETQDPAWLWQKLQLDESIPLDGVMIGQPDTGLTQHPQLHGARIALELGRNNVEHRPFNYQHRKVSTHGTGTASLMVSPYGGATDTVRGLVPSATLVPFRAAPSVFLRTQMQIRGLRLSIRQAVDAGCHVLSISMGSLTCPPELDATLRWAAEQGVIIVAAAGQIARSIDIPFSRVAYPAAHPKVIAAAACHHDGRACDWSARGPEVDITAYGDGVWRADWDHPSKGDRSWGTSFATVCTAAVAALWLKKYEAALAAFPPGQRVDLFRDALHRAGLDEVGNGKPGRWGAGVLHGARVLACPPQQARNKSAGIPMADQVDWFREALLQSIAAAGEDAVGPAVTEKNVLTYFHRQLSSGSRETLNAHLEKRGEELLGDVPRLLSAIREAQ